MNHAAYLDLLRSNIDVVKENVALVIETLEDENIRLTDRVFMVEKENMRLQTENRMMKEECNRLKGEVIKLMDTVAECSKPVEDIKKVEDHTMPLYNGYCDKGDPDEVGCAYTCECPTEFDGLGCPDCGCCKDHYKATGVVTNETN